MKNRLNELVISKIKPGDVLLHRGKNFIARQIRVWMEKARKRMGLKSRTLYNHASIVVEIWGELWVVEAVARGSHMIPLKKRLESKDKILVKTWVKPLTKKEVNSLSKKAVIFVGENHNYQYSAFIFHIIKITFGKWLGRKNIKAQHKINCTELVAIFMDYIRNCFEGKTYDISPLDIDLNKYLIKKEKLKFLK